MGSYWPDLSRYKNNGRIYGAQLRHGAMWFNGVNTNVNCGNHETLKPPELTIEVWVKNILTENTTYDQLILSTCGDNKPEHGYVLTWGWGNDLYWRAGDGTDWHNLCVINLPRGEKWYFIAATFRNGEQLLYVNGELKDSNNLSFDIVYDSSPLLIGKAGTARLQGFVGELLIYDVVRTPEQIRIDAQLTSPYGTH